jgi:hypothetical protein
MVSLHDLRSPAVAMEWHEAVAVAAALAARIVDGDAAGREVSCPHPEDVALLPDGTLRVTGLRHLGATPAQGAALVIAQLLEALPCPVELRQLVQAFEADSTEPAADRVAAFLARLAFFERPGRTEVLAALAARAEPVVEHARRTAALEALTERARQAADEPAPRGLAALIAGSVAAPVPPPARLETPAGTEPPAWEPAASPVARWLLPAALALVAFVAAATAASWWLTPAAAPAASTRPEEDLPIEGPAGPGQVPAPAGGDAAARRTAGTAGPPAPRMRATPAEPPAPTPSSTAPAPVATAGPVPGPVPGPVRSTRDVDVIVAERDGRVLPPAGAADRTARSAPGPSAPGRVFSAADPQVIPAVLIRPHLPAQPPPDVPEEQIGTLEFVVTESGAVEHVHLISPANRFQERMLVAAAKTWQFQPAMRDGRPVRYRTRIRVTL